MGRPRRARRAASGGGSRPATAPRPLTVANRPLGFCHTCRDDPGARRKPVALPPARADRRGRDGRGLEGARHRARPPGGDQDPARAAVRRRDRP
ncbi:MAG: hypothetical protein GTO46_02535, partial [Gemmatimonadetes bacterium]|nr:hypothetical protein [Gemmatimonadota bacterium]NIP63046.1 hypothetical protein [Gammaproteobacteria bacterium]